MSVPSSGHAFAGYNILSECGRGAYGRVYLATDAIGRRVALKYLPSADAKEYELRGLRNYMSVASPSNALLRIFHCGVEDGCLFYVMEAADNAAAEGESYRPDTLAYRLTKSGRIPAVEVLALAHSILDGLESLHAAGLLHRDIKPENILFVNGEPKLADPGLMRQFNETLSVAGTPGYIPPEFYAGHSKGSPAADIYALGKLIYHSVTGNNPELYPRLPDDVPASELYQICRPLAKLCNSVPQKRCQTCAEARRILPQTIVPQTFLHAIWAPLAVRPKLRRLVLYCALAVVLLCGGIAATVVGVVRHRAALLRNVQTELDTVRNSTLDLQLMDLGLPACAPALDKIQRLADSGKATAAATALRDLRQEMSETAAKNLPADTASSLLAHGQGWSFLSSPLCALFTPAAEQEALRNRLLEEARAFSPVPGSPFNMINSISIPVSLVFTPPCVIRSPLNQVIRKIPYPYWICSTEISGPAYYYFTQLETVQNHGNTSVEFLSWNDALSLCRKMTSLYSKLTSLPKGYAFRIPTEAEWEAAAIGGWKNSMPPSKTIPPGTKRGLSAEEGAGHCGLFNIDDNLAELVEPYPDVPIELQGAAVVRGANYRQPETSITYRTHYVRDQFVMRGASGIRPVLAPTDDDYYATAWYRGPTIRTYIAEDGAVYAGFAIVQSALSWKGVVHLAEALGASLPENRAVIADLYPKLSLPWDWTTALPYEYNDGAWRSVTTKEPFQAESNLPEATQGRTCLAAYPHTLVAFAPEFSFAVIILKWADEEHFRHRLDSFLKSTTVQKIEVDGRHFVLCGFGKFTGYAVRPFVDFLGGRQPVFSTLDSLKKVVAALPPDRRCAIGPIRFYDSWEQPDRSLLDLADSPVETSFLNAYFSPSESILAASQGKLLNADIVDSILLEVE